MMKSRGSVLQHSVHFREREKTQVAPMVSGTEPNAENKLFVGGCPPGSSEEDLRQVFEKYGQVEEVFIMRGGSRSGMACAFIRFGTRDMAQSAIDAIHGQITLPKTSEPLVVRWADAPGTRKKESRDRRPRTSSSNHARDGNMQVFPNYMHMPLYPQHAEMQMHPHVYTGNYYMHQPLAHNPAWQHHHMGHMAMMSYPPQLMHPQAAMMHNPMMPTATDHRTTSGFGMQGLQQQGLA